MTEETIVWAVVNADWQRRDLKVGDLSNLDAYTSIEAAERAAGRADEGAGEVYEIKTKLVSVVRTIKTTEVERF
jgi:hypothetical protein